MERSQSNRYGTGNEFNNGGNRHVAMLSQCTNQLQPHQKDEETIDLMFLKFGRCAFVDMGYSHRITLQAIKQIMIQRDTQNLDERGVIEKILQMEDAGQTQGDCLQLDADTYKHFMDIGLGVRRFLGDNSCPTCIKNIIRHLLQQHNKEVDLNSVANEFFNMQPLTPFQQQPETDSCPSHLDNITTRHQDTADINNRSGALIPPTNSHGHLEVGASIEPSRNTTGLDATPANDLRNGQENRDSSRTSAFSTSSWHTANDQETIRSNNSSGSSGGLPLGATASTFHQTSQAQTRSPETEMGEYFQKCCTSFKGHVDPCDIGKWGKKMVFVTVYPNVECGTCKKRSTVYQQDHHEHWCQYKDPDMVASISSSSSRFQHGCQSNSGCSSDLNVQSNTRPISDSSDQQQAGFRNRGNMITNLPVGTGHQSAMGPYDRDNICSGDVEMGACGGPSEASFTANPQHGCVKQGQPPANPNKPMDPDECKVCKRNPADRVLVPCKHPICHECEAITQKCGVCEQPIIGCQPLNFSFRKIRGSISRPDKVQEHPCTKCKNRVGDILQIYCGHFVCDNCTPQNPSNPKCQACDMEVVDLAREDVLNKN